MPTVRIYRARGVIERGIRGLPENIIGADLGGETIFYDAVDKNTSYDLCGFTVTAADLKVRGYEKVPEKLCVSEDMEIPTRRENEDMLRKIPTGSVRDSRLLYSLWRDFREEIERS